jgi:hypothetical protein
VSCSLSRNRFARDLTHLADSDDVDPKSACRKFLLAIAAGSTRVCSTAGENPRGPGRSTPENVKRNFRLARQNEAAGAADPDAW